MARFEGAFLDRAHALVEVYPEPRSATIPLCHLAQEQDGFLSREAMVHISELVGTIPAEVLSSASFYDMFHMEPVGRYLVGVCTNVACMLQGAYELLESAEEVFGITPGMTSDDGLFTLEEMECVAHCDKAPCAQVNYRYFGPLTKELLVELRDDLASGRLDETVPPHGTLIRTLRSAPPVIAMEEIDAERVLFDQARAQRESDVSSGGVKS